MHLPIHRLPSADCAHVEGELRARERGEEFPPARPDDRDATCPACGAARPMASIAPLSAGELDALHFRFWSADHKRFDHIGFAYAVIAACARVTAQTPPSTSADDRGPAR